MAKDEINKIIEKAKAEGCYADFYGPFEQEIYNHGFENAVHYMLWNPRVRECLNCRYRFSREPCGEDYCGTKYWEPELDD